MARDKAIDAQNKWEFSWSVSYFYVCKFLMQCAALIIVKLVLMLIKFVLYIFIYCRPSIFTKDTQLIILL